jgi:hypothetical protein
VHGKKKIYDILVWKLRYLDIGIVDGRTISEYDLNQSRLETSHSMVLHTSSSHSFQYKTKDIFQ